MTQAAAVLLSIPQGAMKTKERSWKGRKLAIEK